MSAVSMETKDTSGESNSDVPPYLKAGSTTEGTAVTVEPNNMGTLC